MAAEIDGARPHLPKKSDSRSPTGAVRGRRRRRRGTVLTLLAKRKVAAEDGYARLAESAGDRHQQRSVAISSGSMGQDDSISPPSDVEKSANAALLDRDTLVE